VRPLSPREHARACLPAWPTRSAALRQGFSSSRIHATRCVLSATEAFGAMFAEPVPNAVVVGCQPLTLLSFPSLSLVAWASRLMIVVAATAAAEKAKNERSAVVIPGRLQAR
jgi:hypothetical protein